MAENQPRILIADDHRLVAEAVKKLLVLEFNVLEWSGMDALWSKPP
jgi:DNA-binding NarL/FixJ family response regulator